MRRTMFLFFLFKKKNSKIMVFSGFMLSLYFSFCFKAFFFLLPPPLPRNNSAASPKQSRPMLRCRRQC